MTQAAQTQDAHFPGHFGTVAIVGVGLIGGSLGMALKRRRLARRVVGVGRTRERMDAALRLGAVDAGTTELAEGVRDADVVVLCTTVGHIVDSLPDVLARVKPGAVVTDVGSTKGAICGRAAGCPRFVGGHPMAGSEQAGVEAATPLLFEEATWAVTPTGETDAGARHTVERLAREVGATTLTLSPDAHDAILAVTSHLPHVLASALMRQADGARRAHPPLTQLTAGSFADATRVAASPPPIWRDVCLTNREALRDALAAFRAELDTLEEAVAAGDAGRIEAFFGAGADAKRGWGAP
jgi:prephenate dehydrogenase